MVVGWLLIQPSNDRDWNEDQKLLAYAEIRGDEVFIRNIRNFRYQSESNFAPAYYDKSFDLTQLRDVWFIVEHFGDWKGPAHTFLSFDFGNQGYVAVSVEIRKEKGESFSPLKGLFKRYEVMYVIGDENDLIKLRTNFRNDPVYLYRARTTAQNKRALFLQMIERANHLRSHPEFYNTLTNTCTTNIVNHINALSPRRVPFSYKVLLPGYSDRLAWELGLLDTDVSFEETRERHFITPRAQQCQGDCDFSAEIRRFETRRASEQQP